MRLSAFVCADNGKQIAEDIYGARFVWVPYVRPGFTLSKMIADGVANNPNAELVLMEKHGLVTWGDTSEKCYEKTISIIQEAEQYIHERINQKQRFGGRRYESLPADKRKQILAGIMPVIRGAVSDEKQMILSYDDHEEVLEFVNSVQAPELSNRRRGVRITSFIQSVSRCTLNGIRKRKMHRSWRIC